MTRFTEPSVRPAPGAWRRLLADAGFRPVVVEPIDGAFGVLAQIVYSAGYTHRAWRLLAALLMRWDTIAGAWTTGYGIVARRDHHR